MRTALRRILFFITITNTILVTISPHAQPLTTFRIANGTSGENPVVLWVGAYSSDLTPKPEGLQKIYSILSRTNPKLSTLKPESILDATFIQKIQSSGY